MQIASANSSDAKNTKIPATTNAATFKLNNIKTVIINVNKNPIRAAKIFGALSIFFF